MSEKIKTVCVRFNLEKTEHRKAYEFLTSRGKKNYSSNSQAIVAAVNYLCEKENTNRDESFLQNGEKEDTFIQQIVGKVGEEIAKNISAYFAACLAEIINSPAVKLPNIVSDNQAEQESAEDLIDYEFLGG